MPYGKDSVGPMSHDHAWIIKVNGEDAPDVALIECASKYGVLLFGRFPDGHEGWRWKEQGGGGSISLPYTFTPDGTLLVGMLEEQRENLGGRTLCIAGGFVHPDESHASAAVRETEQELATGGVMLEELPGVPMVGNRLYSQANISDGEGVHTYASAVPFDELVREEDSSRYTHRSWTPKPGAKIVFLPWDEAVRQSPDALLRAAVALLLAEMRRKCKMVIGPQ